ncbi:LytTR family DNA-binding domain-containing protein [Paenibacillus alvei]|uniref:LytTR family DNA-binding domain-containing protein n=1 Tax=Paenibacillus alvei TaxID=44250 RepID=A0ABT4GXG2_PAEAL|nr:MULTISPECIES: LytTR family DNA-binding domain-containing protein [Paenibacillus]MCY7486581.1 LytTR family DNA-binding domain-containing protein [Paenibacillus alvei]MCY9761400.1 LytTR family DNA-binding domain-containing protein [Paenibacillus alvei]MCY9767160.1 LytTR family DNA-binding domain-containing protein [Paenibacillus alvei]
MRAIIVEDEVLASEELEYLITKHSRIEIVERFEDGLDVLKFLQEKEVDAIFLDINIPSLDGMLLATNISKFAHKPYVIFTTAYKEHAAQAFELEAFDYILKPYDENRIAAMLRKLETAFERDVQQGGGSNPADNRPKSEEKRINLLKNDKYIVTDSDDIYYAEAQEKVTNVFTKSGTYTMPMSISDFHAMLPQDRFYRCHRSYTVNLSQIHEIVPWFNNTYLLRLRDMDAEVPVSRSKVKEFRQLMHI